MTPRRRTPAVATLRVALALLLLAGCAGELTAPAEPLRLLATSLPTAFVGEPLDLPLRPTGGLRPYQFALVDGALPRGVALTNGRLVGAPTAEGRFAFTVEVSDASLSRTVRRYELLVRPLPSPTLVLDAPLTDVQRPTTLRLRLETARGWRGARIEIEWDATAFTLADEGVTPSRPGVATFWEAGDGSLRIDVAALGPLLDGEHELLRFTLVPIEPGPMDLTLRAEHRFVGGHHYATGRAGASAPAAPAAQDDPLADPESPFDDPSRDPTDPVDDDPDEGGTP
jgi:hypothetical protein